MNEKTTRGLIFDIDGTLVDSNDLHAEAWRLSFLHFGVEVSFDQVRSNIGKGGDLLVPDILNAREMQRFGEELKKYRKELFRKDYLPKVKPIGPIAEHFRELRDRGITIVLATSSDPDEVKHHIALLGIEKLIDGYTSKEDAEHSKPYPEIFDAALEKAGTPREQTATVGDTPYDILASHRCAIAIAAVRSGGFEEKLLQKAEFRFDDVADLVRNIRRLDEYFASA